MDDDVVEPRLNFLTYQTCLTYIYLNPNSIPIKNLSMSSHSQLYVSLLYVYSSIIIPN